MLSYNTLEEEGKLKVDVVFRECHNWKMRAGKKILQMDLKKRTGQFSIALTGMKQHM